MPDSVYRTDEIDAKFAALPKPTDLSGYYTKAQVDAAIAAAVGASPPPPPPPDPTPTPTTRYFAATSSWNTKVPTSGVNYRTVSNMTGGWVNYDSYSTPLIISKPSDPVVNVKVPGSWGWPAGTIQVRIPASVVSGSPGTDGTLIVVDGNTAYDFWQFTRTGTNGSCSSWAKSDIVSGSGWGQKSPFLAAGIHATGSACLAGLIVGNELTTGINHAVAFGAGRNLAGPMVGEAIASDGSATGAIPEGARLAIPRTTPAPTSLKPQSKILWTALQEYGAFCIDTAGGDQYAIHFGADPNSVPQADVDALMGGGWPPPDLAAMVTAMRRIL